MRLRETDAVGLFADYPLPVFLLVHDLRLLSSSSLAFTRKSPYSASKQLRNIEGDLHNVGAATTYCTSPENS
ncbi:hypothetical protein ACRALDRAFT_210788 [Sodiomyces alcalophilus JCM 7366]|uniref:uncharacterized protein n=1 Tax=Sodiomyces alcalophilus JCM 7366 TaxID=591952 RepID=UPI0039B56B59